MENSGQVHALNSHHHHPPPIQERTKVPFEWEVWCTPQPIWACLEKMKILYPYRMAVIKDVYPDAAVFFLLLLIVFFTALSINGVFNVLNSNCLN
jgi:hypothetical protein